MNMLRRLWPTSWTADIDYDPHENIDFDFADAGTWNEADHPRDPDGKFTIAGGGAGAAPALTKYAGPAGAKMAQKLDDLINNGGNPYKLGKEIVAEASKFKSSNVAGYMNQLLKHMELHYGAPMGTFGKAVKQKAGGPDSSPLVEAEPPESSAPSEAEIDKMQEEHEAALAALPESKPSGAIHPVQEQMTKVLQSTWPDDEKKSWIEALKAELPEDDTEGHAFAQGHLEKLGGQPAPSPAAAPAAAPAHPGGNLDQLSQEEYDAYTKAIPMPNGPQDQQDVWEVVAHPGMSKASKLAQLKSDKEHFAAVGKTDTVAYVNELIEHLGGDTTEPKPTLPTPPTGHSLQKAMYAYATMQSLTTEEKVAKLNELTSKASAGQNKEYGKNLIEALGGTVTAAPEPEKPTPPPPLPDPKPGSNTQQSMYVIAADNPGVGGKTNTEKIAAITEALKNSTGSKGGAAETYANELITALGGQPVDVDALKYQAPTPEPTPAAQPATAKPKTGGPRPNVHGAAAMTPSKIVTAKATARTAYAIKTENNAKQPKGSDTQEAREVIPSIRSEFWDDVDYETKSAITDYGGSGYDEINGGLRGSTSISPKYQKKIDKIDEQFFRPEAVIEHDLIIRRGENTSQTAIAEWREQLAKGPPPCLYARSGYTSASTADTPAFSSKPVWWHFTVPKGHRVLGIAGTVGHYENEVLLMHGQQTEIYEIWEAGGKTHIKAMVV